MSENDTIHQLILEHLSKSDLNQNRIFDKLDEQGKTLGRLTTTVEIHQKYSENLEKEQKVQREDLDSIDTSIKSINTHVTKVELVMKLLTPTKTKVATFLAVASLFGGNQAIKSPTIQKVLKILSEDELTTSRVIAPIKPTPKPGIIRIYGQ